MEILQNARDEDVEDESIGSFISRRLGPDVVDRVVSAIIHGIYAGDVWQLSAKSLFPMPWKDEVEAGSIMGGAAKTMQEGPRTTARATSFLTAMKSQPLEMEYAQKMARSSVFTFRNGLNQLVDTLADHLREKHNVRFLTNTKVQKVTYQEADQNVKVSVSNIANTEQNEAMHTHAISTLAPAHLNKVVQPHGSPFKFDSITAVTVMTVCLYFRTPDLHPPGFGYLIPLATSLDQNPERALGVVFDTSYSLPIGVSDSDIEGLYQDTVRKRGTKLTVMLGGHYWNGWPVFPSEDEGLQMALSLLERHLGITEKPAASAMNLQSDCIPQYHVGHERILRREHDKLRDAYKGKLRVAGNWISGVGVNDCLRSAWDVVSEIRDEGKTGLEPVVEPKIWARRKMKK